MSALLVLLGMKETNRLLPTWAVHPARTIDGRRHEHHAGDHQSDVDRGGAPTEEDTPDTGDDGATLTSSGLKKANTGKVRRQAVPHDSPETAAVRAVTRATFLRSAARRKLTHSQVTAALDVLARLRLEQPVASPLDGTNRSSPSCTGGYAVTNDTTQGTTSRTGASLQDDSRVSVELHRAFAAADELVAKAEQAMGHRTLHQQPLPRSVIAVIAADQAEDPDVWAVLAAGNIPVVVAPRSKGSTSGAASSGGDGGCDCGRGSGATPQEAVGDRASDLLREERLSSGGFGGIRVVLARGHNLRGAATHEVQRAGRPRSFRDFIKHDMTSPWTIDSGMKRDFLAFTMHDALDTTGTPLYRAVMNKVKARQLRWHVPLAKDGVDLGGRLLDVFLHPEGSGTTPHIHTETWQYEAYGAKTWLLSEPSHGGVRRWREGDDHFMTNLTMRAARATTADEVNGLVREAADFAALDRRVSAFRSFVEVAPGLQAFQRVAGARVQRLLSADSPDDDDAVGNEDAQKQKELQHVAEVVAATGIMFTQPPGHMVYLPHSWWHTTLALDPTAAIACFGYMGEEDALAKHHDAERYGNAGKGGTGLESLTR